MRASRRVVGAMAVILLLLFGAAVGTKVTNRYQVLPFSDWSLFSTLPEREQVDYGLRITSIDGEALDPPVYFESAGLRGSKAPPSFELIQDIGGHVEQGQPLRADVAWRTFAGRYLTDVDSAQVEVVERRYDVLDRRRCDCFETETVIATLEMGP